jgi:hypothetical protein
MTKINNMADRESPWRGPQVWQIFSPGSSLRRILILVVDRRAKIHSHQPLGKPAWQRISRRNGQAAESQALAMSILSSKVGTFFAWRSRAEPWTKRKLS